MGSSRCGEGHALMVKESTHMGVGWRSRRCSHGLGSHYIAGVCGLQSRVTGSTMRFIARVGFSGAFACVTRVSVCIRVDCCSVVDAT